MTRERTLLTDYEFAVLASHGLTQVEIVHPSEARVWFEGRRVGMKVIRKKRNAVRLYGIYSDDEHLQCSDPEVEYGRGNMADLISYLVFHNTVRVFFEMHENDPVARQKPVIFHVHDNSISFGLIDDLADVSQYNGLIIRIGEDQRHSVA